MVGRLLTRICKAVKDLLLVLRRRWWQLKIRTIVSLKWKDLPLDLQQDIEMVCCGLHSRRSCRARRFRMQEQLFETAPGIANERKVWESLLAVNGSNGHLFNLNSLLKKFAPLQLLSDRDFMKRACVKDALCFYRMDESMQKDRKFLCELQELNTNVRKLPYFHYCLDFAVLQEAWFEIHECIQPQFCHFDFFLWKSIKEYIEIPDLVAYQKAASI